MQPGQMVVDLADPNLRDAVIDAPAAAAAALTVGTPFEVAAQLDSSVRVGGKVREIAPQADAATRTRRVKITLDHPPNAFRLGSTITAWPVEGARKAVRLPASAILVKDAKPYVWIVDPATSKVALREVVLAAGDADPVEVTSGLDPRDASGDRRRPLADRGPAGAAASAGDAVSRFNLSEWALEHRSLVWYFMIVFAVAGVFSYLGLGREEDPNFTIKTMIIQAQWPGASAAEVAKQVTDRIEKKLEELESLDFTRSVTTAGQTIVFVNLLPTTKAKDVPYAWVSVRNMIGDIQSTFPSGVVGPSFNDRFGDVYGNIMAFTADGLTDRQLRDYVEFARSKVLTVPNVGQVQIIGARDEAIYLDFSTRKTAALGLDAQAIAASLRAQNAITPSGTIEAGPERISVRIDGQFASEASLRAINLRVNDRFFPLTDVATVRRGLVDPPGSLFRFNGKPGIALAVGMKAGSNLLNFGAALGKEDDGDRRRSPGRREYRESLRSAGGGGKSRLRLHRGAVRGDRHCAGDQLRQPGPARGPRRGDRHSPGAGDHLSGDVGLRHFAAAHLARRADHRARPAGRRRDDRRRDDGGASRSRRHAAAGGDACLCLDGVSDADRDAGDGGGLHPDRAELQRRR